ncbi:MAG: sodium-dependent transporter [Candidatus Thermoplasmatota archaeon]|nr:sodium-dependent transporter [Candidatus Thermoplasmatota archaeon]
MAALGAAIGTGNIWRFPKEVANNGGGSFMIPYVIFLFAWSIPILLVEFNLGKKSRKGTMGTFTQFLGTKKTWMGAWLTWISTAIGFYYAVVMGWTLRYAFGSITGSVSFHSVQAARDSWEGFLGSPFLMVFFQVLAIAITSVIVYRGVEKGVERVNKVLIPTLFVLLIIGMIRAVFLPGALDGIAYLFTPNSRSLFNARTWVSALAQSAWSCSAGMGMAITYGAYTKRKSDTNLNTFLTGLGDTTIALVAGIMIFATVFGVSASPALAEAAVEEGGSGLTFIYLPSLFGEMAGGPIIAVMFFLAMAFAALTSMIATYENAVKNFVDAGWDRKKAIRTLTVGMLVLGLPSALIILPVSGTPMPVFLDNQDFVWGLGLIVSGAFLYYLVLKYGITRFRNNIVNSRYDDIKVGKWFDVLFRFVIPIELVVMSGWFLIQTLMAPSEEWWLGGTIGLGILLLQWGASIAGLILLSRKVGPRMIDQQMNIDRSIDDDIDILEGSPHEVEGIVEVVEQEPD